MPVRTPLGLRDQFLRRVAYIVLVACSALAAGGCVPDLYGSTRPLIKIGLAAPFEGLGRPLGYEALQGVKMALAERNAAGGVGGYMVELVALNDSDQPDEAATQALEFAADPAILGVITGWRQGVASAALPAYRQAGVAVVVPWSVPAELADPAHGVVLLAADSDRVARTAADHLAAVVGDAGVAVVGDAAAVSPYLALASLPVWRVPLPDSPTAALLGDTMRRLFLARPAPPSALVLVTTGAQAGDIVRAARDIPWDGPILISPDGADPQLVDVAGAVANGVLIASAAPDGTDLPERRNGAEALLGGLGPRGVQAYDAVQVLLAAIEAAAQADGQPTRDGVIRALSDVKASGLTGEITIASDGRRRDARVWWYQISDNHYPGILVE